LVTRKNKVSAEFPGCAGKFVGTKSIAEHTIVELTGTDRPGLLSEVSAVLTSMDCRVHAAEVWTHNRRCACMIYITDEDTSGPLCNVRKLVGIKERLRLVMKGDNDERRVARTNVAAEGVTHPERRLHQLMFADKDYEASEKFERSKSMGGKVDKPTITVQSSCERGYSIINVQCKDRPKLLFDTVCTLTDMQYDVFHATATVDPFGPLALQEFHIRQMDGQTLSPGAEEQVKKCLEAAIERRSSKGLRLELCTGDRVGLLSDMTRIFLENGLSVTRADVSTQGDKAINVFYVTDPSGNPVDKTVERIRRNYPILGVKERSSISESPQVKEQASSPLSSFLKSSERFFQGLTTGWKMSTVA
jgi:UTP:GlnB (protein PII) uridylyltransferase